MRAAGGTRRSMRTVRAKKAEKPVRTRLGAEARAVMVVERFIELREATPGMLDASGAKSLVRELKAVGGNLKSLRLALTGAERGPELSAVVAALSGDEAIRRARAAL